MRKYLLIALVTYFINIVPTITLAASANVVHQYGFADLSWGQTINEIAYTHNININDYKTEKYYKVYELHKDFLYVYNIEARPIIYLYFYNDKLAKIKIFFDSYSSTTTQYNTRKIRDGIITVFGKPEIYNKYYQEYPGQPHLYEWTTETSDIKLWRYGGLKQNVNYPAILEMDDVSIR